MPGTQFKGRNTNWKNEFWEDTCVCRQPSCSWPQSKRWELAESLTNFSYLSEQNIHTINNTKTAVGLPPVIKISALNVQLFLFVNGSKWSNLNPTRNQDHVFMKKPLLNMCPWYCWDHLKKIFFPIRNQVVASRSCSAFHNYKDKPKIIHSCSHFRTRKIFSFDGKNL